MRMRGNVGVREVKTETLAAGALIRNERRTTDSNTCNECGTGTVAPSYTREYTDTLPSANFQFEIRDNFSIRIGYAELMARPTITELAPTGTCTIRRSPGAATDNVHDGCNIGNPGLKPYRAKSYDLEFAYYPSDEIEMRVGAFYKDITLTSWPRAVRGVEPVR